MANIYLRGFRELDGEGDDDDDGDNGVHDEDDGVYYDDE